MGTRTTPDTPYRKGFAAGTAYYRLRQSRAALPLAERVGVDAPIPPENPYDRRKQPRAYSGWEMGVGRALDAVEKERRAGGKR
jgi:hypothetical protein